MLTLSTPLSAVGEARGCRRSRTTVFGLILSVAALLVAGCGGGAVSATPAVAPPSSVTIVTRHGAPGVYLTDSAGRSLYMWEADPANKSTCAGACATAWPPLLVAGAATAGDGVTSALLGTFTRSDGTRQVTYHGWPLYYFAGDKKPGDLAGQGNTGFGAAWWVISPAGDPLPSEPAPGS